MDFGKSILRGASFRGCSLGKADFTGCDLRDAVFTGADLTEAILRECPSGGADFTDAVVAGASADAAFALYYAAFKGLKIE